MNLLQAVAEHGAVVFLEDVTSDDEAVLGSDAEDMSVERGVVKFAERNPV